MLGETSANRRVQVPHHAVYINLDRRPDRHISIEHQLRLVGLKAKRISAVEGDKQDLQGCWDHGEKQCAGQIGCQMSHIRALEYAISQDWEHVAVFEDDFEWSERVDPKYVMKALDRVHRLHPDWDLIAISLNLLNYSFILPEEIIQISETATARVSQIREAQTTHGYIVRKRFLPKVLDAFQNCDLKLDYMTAIDTCWKALQGAYKWYALVPQLGVQAVGYSDIEKQKVDYMNELNVAA